MPGKPSKQKAGTPEGRQLVGGRDVSTCGSPERAAPSQITHRGARPGGVGLARALRAARLLESRSIRHRGPPDMPPLRRPFRERNDGVPGVRRCERSETVGAIRADPPRFVRQVRRQGRSRPEPPRDGQRLPGSLRRRDDGPRCRRRRGIRRMAHGRSRRRRGGARRGRAGERRSAHDPRATAKVGIGLPPTCRRMIRVSGLPLLPGELRLAQQAWGRSPGPQATLTASSSPSPTSASPGPCSLRPPATHGPPVALLRLTDGLSAASTRSLLESG